MNFIFYTIRPILFCLAIGCGLGGGAGLLWGQEAGLHPLSPADTSSPRATLASFLESCSAAYGLLQTEAKTRQLDDRFLPTKQRILDCLDLRELPEELVQTTGIEAAVFLKESLDRVELPAWDEIPGQSEAGELDSPLTVWRIPDTRIFLTRLEEGPRRGDYVLSADSVRRAAAIYRAAKLVDYRRSGPPTTPGLLELYIAATKRQPTLSADTASPRGTLTLFMDSCDEIYELIRENRFIDRLDPQYAPLVGRIVGCLDNSRMPEFAQDYYASEAAVCLKEILDRIQLPPAEAIPGIESLTPDKGGEPLLRWQIPESQITIVRITEGPRAGEYLFSSDSVKRAPEFYEKTKQSPYRTEGRPVAEGFHDWYLGTPGNPAVARLVNRLPSGFKRRFYQLAWWQWFGLTLCVTLAILLMVALYRTAQWVKGNTPRSSLFRYWLAWGISLLAMFVPLGLQHVAFDFLTLRSAPLYTLTFVTNAVFLMALMLVVVGASVRIAESIIALPIVQPEGLDADLIRVIGRVLGIAIAAIVFLEGGQYLGFPLTTLIASAGVGGLAIAFAAQGVLKNLFGTVTILFDKPYRVGERIRVKGHDGTVEEIGLRSTKIRDFETNQLLSIPNDQMAESEIQNIGRRAYIRRMMNLRVPIDTSRERLVQALDVIRETLQDHEGQPAEFPPRVVFNDILPDGFNIRIMFGYEPPDVWRFLAFSEKLNLEIFAAFEAHGIQFSLPLRHTYWREDDQQGPLDIRLHGSGDEGSEFQQPLRRGASPELEK